MKNKSNSKNVKRRRYLFGLIAILAIAGPLAVSHNASAQEVETETYDNGHEACMGYGIFTYKIDGTHSSPYLTVPNLLPDWDVTAVVIASGNADGEHHIYTPVEEGQTINFGQSIHHVHICKTQIVPEYPPETSAPTTEPEVTTSTSTSTTTAIGPTTTVSVTTTVPSTEATAPSTTSEVGQPPVPPTTQCTITSTTVLVPHPCLPVFPEGTSTTTSTVAIPMGEITSSPPTRQLPVTGLSDPLGMAYVALAFLAIGGFLLMVSRLFWKK